MHKISPLRMITFVVLFYSFVIEYHGSMHLSFFFFKWTKSSRALLLLDHPPSLFSNNDRPITFVYFDGK